MRLKDSLLYGIYLKIRFPRDDQRLQSQAAFLKAVMGSKTHLAFDVGANRGDKAKIFSKIFRQVLCVEPDPAAVWLLRRRFSRQNKIVVIPKGVDQESGEGEFFTLSEGNPRNSFSPKWIQGQCTNRPRSQKVELTTLDHLIQEHGKPDLIKLDVEGFELRALRGLRIPVYAVCFECNLPQFKEETLGCVQCLAQCSNRYLFNYTDAEATRFCLEEWNPAEVFLRVIHQFQGPYMEIYARLKS